LADQDSVTLTQGLVATVGEEKGLLQFGQKRRLFGVLPNGSSSTQPDNSAEQYAILSLSQAKDLQVSLGEDLTKSEELAKSNKKQSA
jgi:peroxin-1